MTFVNTTSSMLLPLFFSDNDLIANRAFKLFIPSKDKLFFHTDTI